MTDFRNLFKRVRRAPRMFLLSDRYEVVVAFVCGCDAATDGRLLAGFQEWVAPRLTNHSDASVSWSQLIADKVAPEGLSRPLLELPSEYGAAATEELFELLDEFLAERHGFVL
jgi:hypothetical protein